MPANALVANTQMISKNAITAAAINLEICFTEAACDSLIILISFVMHLSHNIGCAEIQQACTAQNRRLSLPAEAFILPSEPIEAQAFARLCL